MKKMAEILTWYGYQYDNWKEYADISQEIEKYIVGESFNPHARFFSKALAYIESVQVPSLSLFIGLFIAGVFFPAAASFLYFRLFTDLYEEREKYKALAKIGLSEKEMATSATVPQQFKWRFCSFYPSYLLLLTQALLYMYCIGKADFRMCFVRFLLQL